jgi:hypothetical protein
MIYAYPDEIAPSPNGIDSVNVKSYQYPIAWEGIPIPVQLTAGTSTPWIITPRGVTKLYLNVKIVGAGEYYVRYSCDSLASIKNGTCVYQESSKYNADALIDCEVVSAIQVHCHANNVKVYYHAR